MKVKVHRVVLLIVDHDQLGDESVQEELEAVSYPNDCLSPQVMKIDTREVEWSDDHDLNRTDSRQERAFAELFRDV